MTARNTDVGALINAGSGVGGGTGPQLFRVADVHEMRVFVQVPQEMSAGMHAGLTADLVLPQYPDKTFKAVVATTAEAINKTSRTLLVELHADNTDNLLQPGTFAQVRFNLADNPGALRIPTSALIFREDGAQVAILGPDNKVEMKSVKLGRNLGTEFEVLKGLALSDTSSTARRIHCRRERSSRWRRTPNSPRITRLKRNRQAAASTVGATSPALAPFRNG